MIESIFTILSMLVEMAAALAVALIVGKWLAKHVIIGRGGRYFLDRSGYYSKKGGLRYVQDSSCSFDDDDLKRATGGLRQYADFECGSFSCKGEVLCRATVQEGTHSPQYYYEGKSKVTNTLLGNLEVAVRMFLQNCPTPSKDKLSSLLSDLYAAAEPMIKQDREAGFMVTEIRLTVYNGGSTGGPIVADFAPEPAPETSE